MAPWRRPIRRTPNQSWAHYNVYPREDQSQAFRFEGIQIAAYPTVILQPPRDTASTAIPRRSFSRACTAAVPRNWQKPLPRPSGNTSVGEARSQPRRQKGSPFNRSSSTRLGSPLRRRTRHGIGCPMRRRWTACCRSFLPSRRPPNSRGPCVCRSLSAGVSVPTAAAMLIWTIYLRFARRQAGGKPPLVEPEKLDRLIGLLQALAEGSPPPPFRRP